MRGSLDIRGTIIAVADREILFDTVCGQRWLLSLSRVEVVSCESGEAVISLPASLASELAGADPASLFTVNSEARDSRPFQYRDLTGRVSAPNEASA